MYVYLLREPSNLEIRYVGVTKHPDKRHAQHCRASSTPTPCAAWLRSLRSSNQRPVMELVDCVHDWETAEKTWIKCLREDGHKLLNVAEGGVSNEHMRTASRKGKWSGKQTPLQYAQIRFASDYRFFTKHGMLASAEKAKRSGDRLREIVAKLRKKKQYAQIELLNDHLAQFYPHFRDPE